MGYPAANREGDTMENMGTIELKGGYRFTWIRSGTPENGEISGNVKRPDGGFVRRLSGWYRTNDPQEAARIAEAQLVD